MLWHWLLEWPNPTWRAARIDVDDQATRDLRQVNGFAIPLLAGSLLAVLWYFGFTRCAGAAMLWALASLVAGGAVGFLFGIPKAGAPKTAGNKPKATAAADKAGTSTLRPNTNLEEVSDWLTKIIVGLGLVNLKGIEGHVARIAANAAGSWPQLPAAQGQSVATALLTGFAVTGFVGAYVYTRLFLQGAFQRADNSLLSQVEHMQARLAPAPTTPGVPVVPSVPELQVAQQVKEAAKAEDLPVLVERMRALAREYEQVRSTRDPGPQRTQLMSDVVQKMRTLALVTLPALREFADSRSPGERLAAVAMMQVRFDPALTEWLAKRLDEERPFVGFHAASALLGAARLLAGDDLARLLAQVRAARDRLQQRGLADTDRDALLERILREASGQGGS